MAILITILLKVISEVNNSQPNYFIDTGHHFDETIESKDYLTNLFNYNVVSISVKVEDQAKCSEKKL